MAKSEKTLSGNFDEILKRIEEGILRGSSTAKLEASSDFSVKDARCSVRVFERFSVLGANRLSLTVTLFQSGDEPIYLSGITAGGSQAVLFKINTWGENAFLNELEKLLLHL